MNVIVMNRNLTRKIPDEVPPQECHEEKSSMRCRVEENKMRTQSFLNLDAPFLSGMDSLLI